MDQTELTAGVRTVKQVAEYFDELKSSAAVLAKRVTAQERGYFTPDEEDDTFALLISYWQTRNALFDLICTMRGAAGDPRDPDPACFLVAFAAATILIDAARFLRETVDHHAIVRDKLNEPVAQFGIPAGVYDTVQKSLLSARQGWHLYHATNYYRSHVEQLHQAAAPIGGQPLIEIIERLQHRLDVPVHRFTRAKLRTRANQIARSVTWTVVGRALYGLQKLGGIVVSDKYVRQGHKPHLPADIAGELSQSLLPGDVLITRKEYALTNYFLPGYWPHAAMFLGTARQLASLGIDNQEHARPRWGRLMELAESEPGVVLESMKDGVQLRSLTSPFCSDSIAILRPQLSAVEISKGIARGLAHENKPYDFGFDFRRSDRLVCTEVVYRSFDGIGRLRLPLTKRVGRPTLSGGDLVQLTLSGQYFTPIAVYAPGLKPGLFRGEEALPVIATADRGEPPH